MNTFIFLSWMSLFSALFFFRPLQGLLSNERIIIVTQTALLFLSFWNSVLNVAWVSLIQIQFRE